MPSSIESIDGITLGGALSNRMLERLATASLQGKPVRSTLDSRMLTGSDS